MPPFWLKLFWANHGPARWPWQREEVALMEPDGRPSEFRVQDEATFELIEKRVDAVFDRERPFPQWSFRDADARAFLCDFEFADDEEFWPALRDLARLHDDDAVWLLVVSEPSSYFLREFGSYGAFRIPCTADSRQYWGALHGGWSDYSVDAFRYLARTWVAIGASGRWGLWSDFGYEIATVYSCAADGLDKWAKDASHHVLFCEREDAEELMGVALRAEWLRKTIPIFRREFADAEGPEPPHLVSRH